MRIEEFIPIGKDNAIKRKDLCEVVNLPDRKMRAEIEKARERGVVICCIQDGSGYYIAETVEDLIRQYKQDHARAMSILVRLKYTRRELIKNGVSIKNGKIIKESIG